MIIKYLHYQQNKVLLIKMGLENRNLPGIATYVPNFSTYNNSLDVHHNFAKVE